MDLNYAEKYKAGFLEEAAASGLSFINPPPNNPIAFIKLCGPSFLVEGAYIANISITNDLNASLKFKCDVFGKNNVRLFQHLDFETNANENMAGPRMVHGIVFNNDECYLSYSVRLNEQYTTLPIEANGALAFYLSPFAIDPYVGDVKTININTDSINVQPLNSGNSRMLTFVEGYNYELQNSNEFEVPRFELSLPAGGGLGRWPCPIDEEEQESAKYVASINGARPNEIGQIFLNCTNDCLAIEPIKGANKQLKISANCAPCCRCADYNKVGDYIRSYATIYAKMAKEYVRLANLYNSIREQFGGTADCCSTNNKMNARFKIWPQQNFMVQVQALMENNYKSAICLCESRLEVEVKTGPTPLIATETINGVQIQHRIEANTPLILTPLPEASYVYFKNVNPGNQIEVNTSSTGKISVSANLQGGLPIAGPCSDDNTESLPPNCMEPCDGYLMLTAGFTISDPKFRRIVHVLQQNAGNIPFDGIQIPMVLKFSYNGTPEGNPCGNCTEFVTLPAINGQDGVRKLVRIGPNRKSVNPCAPVRLRNITVETDDQGTKYYANFPENTNVNVASGATLLIKRNAYIEETQQWQTITPDIEVQVPVNSETQKILLQSGSSNPLSGIPAGAVGVSFTVTTTGQNMTSKCFPDPSSPNNGEDINVAPSSVTYSVRL